MLLYHSNSQLKRGHINVITHLSCIQDNDFKGRLIISTNICTLRIQIRLFKCQRFMIRLYEIQSVETIKTNCEKFDVSQNTACQEPSTNTMLDTELGVKIVTYEEQTQVDMDETFVPHDNQNSCTELSP